MRSTPLLLVLLTAAAGCRPGGRRVPSRISDQPAAPIVDGDLGRRLDDYLTRAARFGFSGAVLVAKDGRIVLQNGYGLADRETGRRVLPNTVFSIGSLTKQFTAAAILALEEKKRLRTTDSLARFFPDAPADKASITVHQLLTHTAGLPDALGGDFDPITRDSLVRLALATPLQSPPGQRYAYSNVGYSVLAAIVERVSGESYEEFLRDELFAKAGLEETGYDLPWPADRFAIGYDDTTRWGTSVERWKPAGPSWHVVGNGEIQSTVGDMYRWIAALDSGRVLTDSSRRKMVTPWVPEDPTGETRYGYGWVVATTGWGSDVIWHNGSNGVFYADVRRFPRDRAVVVFLTNAFAGHSLLDDLIHVVFGLPAPAIPAPAESLGRAQLERYAGTYRLPSGIPVPVRVSGGRLEAVTSDPEAAMAFVSLTPSGADTGKRFIITDREATSMLERLARGDQAPLLAYLDPPPEARATLSARWRENLERWGRSLGRVGSVRVIGSRVTLDQPTRRFEIYAVIRFERGARIIRLIEREGEGPMFRTVGPIPPGPTPSRVWLVPGPEHRFLAYVPAFKSTVAVRFEPPGREPQAMVLELPQRPLRAVAVR